MDLNEDNTMNKKNLQNLADLPPERRREIARMGGKASARVRAQKKEFQETVKWTLLKIQYLDEANEELTAEWKEFQRWRRQKRGKRYG